MSSDPTRPEHANEPWSELREQFDGIHSDDGIVAKEVGTADGIVVVQVIIQFPRHF